MVEHELVDAFRYLDDGPPPELARDESGGLDGWAVTSRISDDDGWVVITKSVRGWRHTGIRGSGWQIAEPDVTGSGAYSASGVREAAERRRADWLAAQVAEAVDADPFVTDRKYLVAASWDLSRGPTVCSPGDALAILGLYLRSQGDYSILPSWPLSRSIFFLGEPEAAGRRLALGRRLRAPLSLHRQRRTPRIEHERVSGFARALEARDQVHIALSQQQHNDTQEQALSGLDIVLLLLMGAVDAVSRVAHRILRLPGSEFDAGWQRKHWLSSVRRAAPGLAGVLDESHAR